MGSEKRSARRLLDPKIFGLLLGLLIFSAFMGLDIAFDLFAGLETRVSDLLFAAKTQVHVDSRRNLQTGVTTERRSTNISDDIIIIGVDNKTLDAYGEWPFPRSYHARLLNAFSRISDAAQRESVILLDFFFNAIADRAFEDVILLDAIEENGNVVLQPQFFNIEQSSQREAENERRLATLIDNWGEISDIHGDLTDVKPYYGNESPLIPYGRRVAAYGHASFSDDKDDVYRRVQLISRYSRETGEYLLEDIDPDFDFGIGGFGHLAWTNKDGEKVRTDLPLTPEKYQRLLADVHSKGLEKNQGQGDYYIKAFSDHFLPATSLALSLRYLNRELDDITVVYGSHILIPSPMQWDEKLGIWKPHMVPVGIQGRGGMQALDEIRIPIDENGRMRINFVGPRSSSDPRAYQTFPVRSYVAFADKAPGADPDTWPRTKQVGGKILLTGAFTLGMADDEKNTPLGLMFGVEMHANAVNTIIMNSFLIEPPDWVNYLVLLCLVVFFALLVSRMKSLGWSVAILLAYVVISLLTVSLVFDYGNMQIAWATPTSAVVFTFIAVVIYRIIYTEREKRQIKMIFGQFVSPTIVEDLTNQNTTPELGGKYIDGSIMFSDIRGFSLLSERLTSQQLVSLLNEYFSAMTENIVNTWNGTLDKFIGDAVMAFWGAPNPQEDHAVRACRSALEQMKILEELNPKLREKYDESIDIGIGIHVGQMEKKNLQVAYMGSEGCKNYTAMGDAVNLSSRLEGTNKVYRTHIIISEDTKKLIEHEPFIVRELDLLKVKGRDQFETIYELVDYDESYA